MSTFETIAAVCTALGLDPFASGVQLLPASALIPRRADWPAAESPSDGAWSEIQGVGPYQPLVQPYPLLATRPALLGQLGTTEPAALQAALGQRYPASHPLVLVGASGEIAWQGVLGELGSYPADALLYVAPLEPLADTWSADGPSTIMARLLGPKGCPWDREQTHMSLRKDLLGETHEVLEAIDAGDNVELAEELGDLLLQVLIHAEIGRQAGEFTLNDVYNHLASKLIRRHPHVFGDLSVDGSDTVLRNWDVIKKAERAAKGQRPRGTLDGVPVSLPALSLAQETLKKASKAGFDASTAWDWAKLNEEFAELANTSTQSEREEEFGDLLLIAAKIARRQGIDAESALRQAVGKFRSRFLSLETIANQRGIALPELGEAEKLALWAEAKQAN